MPLAPEVQGAMWSAAGQEMKWELGCSAEGEGPAEWSAPAIPAEGQCHTAYFPRERAFHGGSVASPRTASIHYASKV